MVIKKFNNWLEQNKMFESFDSNNPIDVKNDIESILYNLEDYNLRFQFRANGLNLLPCKDLETVLTGGEVNTSDINYFLIGLANVGFKNELDELKEKLEWFLIILKDHLDYIDPKNIYIDEGASGAWIIVKMN